MCLEHITVIVVEKYCAQELFTTDRQIKWRLYSVKEGLICSLILSNNIRIYHECESKIEKSVPRIAVWHHEACRVITNGELEGRIFLSNPHTYNGFFFLLTTVFIYYLF